MVEDGVPAAAAPSDMAKTSRRVGGTRLQSPEEIAVGTTTYVTFCDEYLMTIGENVII